MTTQEMQEIESTATGKGVALDSQRIQSIQLSDGWHNVTQCEIVPFSVSNSPVYQYFPTLKYKNEEGQTVYTPLKQVLSFSEKRSSSAKSM